jgi:hypothetical protein
VGRPRPGVILADGQSVYQIPESFVWLAAALLDRLKRESGRRRDA